MDRGNAVQSRQIRIHEDQIRLFGFADVDRLPAVPGFEYDAT